MVELALNSYDSVKRGQKCPRFFKKPPVPQFD